MNATPAIMIRINDQISIDEDEIEEQFIRSSGPGGQNVNALATAVQLRFDLRNCLDLPSDVRARAERLAGSRLTKEGVIVIEASRFRTQEQNRSDARQRLIDLLKQAAHRPAPRKKTKPSAATRKKRLDTKTRRGAVKKLRRSPPQDN